MTEVVKVKKQLEKVEQDKNADKKLVQKAEAQAWEEVAKIADKTPGTWRQIQEMFPALIVENEVTPSALKVAESFVGVISKTSVFVTPAKSVFVRAVAPASTARVSVPAPPLTTSYWSNPLENSKLSAPEPPVTV